MKVLVIGHGLLGSEIVKQTGWSYISRKNHKIDFTDPSTYLKYIDHYDTILNCVAATDTYSEDKELHWNINYKAVYELINCCNERNKKLVHISTDFVYTHSKEDAKELDVPVHDCNWYSYTKLLGDSLIQLLSNNYLICRCTHKPYPFPYKKAFVDRIGNFDYTEVIAKLIIELINANASGLYNVGTKKKSIYDLVKNDNIDIEPIHCPPGVPKDTSMNINKLNQFLSSYNETI